MMLARIEYLLFNGRLLITSAGFQYFIFNGRPLKMSAGLSVFAFQRKTVDDVNSSE